MFLYKFEKKHNDIRCLGEYRAEKPHILNKKGLAKHRKMDISVGCAGFVRQAISILGLGTGWSCDMVKRCPFYRLLCRQTLCKPNHPHSVDWSISELSHDLKARNGASEADTPLAGDRAIP